MTVSAVASARSISAVMRPSRTTMTRSAMPSTSGSSLEIIRIAMPCPASSLSRRCTSALVPTSMPRVGSSTMSRLGSVASHLASTTFCWLPPLSVPASVSSAAALTSSRLSQMRAAAFSRAEVMKPSDDSFSRIASVVLRATDESSTSPCLRRSSGTSASPSSIAAAGLRFGTLVPRMLTDPAL